MTQQNSKPRLFVVDGSNIATEGRSKPSLEQLTEAVDAFREEYPDVDVTVVVDATFGHRIAKKEVKDFDRAVANNELVTPPAGAVGRGDAFILAIADKAGAGVFSNDSFQEFHGDYGWLFEHGRLIGGKPVPHVGWVFVDRNPVRGPKSRESIRAAKKAESNDEPATAAKERAQRRVRKKKAAASEPSAERPPKDEQGESPSADQWSSDQQSAEPADRSQSGGGKPDEGKSSKHVNELGNFLDFVEKYAVGQTITVKVSSYSSHGAYADFGDVQVYIPLRLMADPAPTSARKAVTTGDEIDVVVAAFSPERRSIDVALPAMSDQIESGVGQADRDDRPDRADRQSADDSANRPKKRRPSRRRGKQSTAESPSSEPAEQTSDEQQSGASDDTPAEAAPPKKRAARKKAAAKKAPAKKAAAKKGAAKKAAAKKAPAKKTAARKRAAKKSAAPAGETGANDS